MTAIYLSSIRKPTKPTPTNQLIKAKPSYPLPFPTRLDLQWRYLSIHQPWGIVHRVTRRGAGLCCTKHQALGGGLRCFFVWKFQFRCCFTIGTFLFDLFDLYRFLLVFRNVQSLVIRFRVGFAGLALQGFSLVFGQHFPGLSLMILSGYIIIL